MCCVCMGGGQTAAGGWRLAGCRSPMFNVGHFGVFQLGGDGWILMPLAIYCTSQQSCLIQGITARGVRPIIGVHLLSVLSGQCMGLTLAHTSSFVSFSTLLSVDYIEGAMCADAIFDTI